MGFIRNVYDGYVANNDIDDSQCTIIWHIDDLKISHLNEKVVTSIINQISERYGGIMPLSISRGKVHDYLGMTFDYSTVGEVKITMYQYINGVIDNAPQIYKEGIGGATPAPPHLFALNKRIVRTSSYSRRTKKRNTIASPPSCYTYQKEDGQTYNNL